MAPAPVTKRHLPGERLRHRALQLRLFEAPIFQREQIALGQRLVASDGLGVGDHAHGVLGEIGGHGGILRRAPEAEQPDARHEHHARAGIELGLVAAGRRILPREISIVARSEFRHRLTHRIGEGVELARLRRRHHERRVLGADDVVGRHHAALAVGGKLRPVHIAEDLRPGAEGGDEADGLLALFCERGRAAQDGRDLGGGG